MRYRFAGLSAPIVVAAVLWMFVSVATAADRPSRTPESPVNVAANEIFFKADANADGSLTKKEFEVAYKMLEKKVTEWEKDGTLAKLPMMRPDGGDGKTPAGEGKTPPNGDGKPPMAKGDGKGPPTLPQIPPADANGDGKVTQEEFQAYVSAVLQHTAMQMRMAATQQQMRSQTQQARPNSPPATQQRPLRRPTQ